MSYTVLLNDAVGKDHEAMASLPVRSIRPLFKIKDPELLEKAILDVEKAAFTPTGGVRPDSRKIIQAIADSIVPPKPRKPKVAPLPVFTPEVRTPEQKACVESFMKDNHEAMKAFNAALVEYQKAAGPNRASEKWLRVVRKGVDQLRAIPRGIHKRVTPAEAKDIVATVQLGIMALKRIGDEFGMYDTPNSNVMNAEFVQISSSGEGNFTKVMEN